MNKEISISIRESPAPYNFYRFITGGDYLHFGYWPEDETENVEDIIDAQKKLSNIITSFIPKQAGRVLDVGCGLGQTAIELAQGGNKVVGNLSGPRTHKICRNVDQKKNFPPIPA